jgi:hypothetical protein
VGQPKHVGAKLRSPSTDARTTPHFSTIACTPRNIRNMPAWRKDRTEKSACVFATSVRHRREMWFSAMHCHGANATNSTTCNHSLEWDKRVSRGQRHQRNGLERSFLPAQNRTVESHGYVLHAARDQLYRSEHRAEATINSATPRALKPKISRRATSKNSRARQAARAI